MTQPFQLISVDAQTALTQFSTEFDQALAAAAPETQWATQFGANKASRFRVRFPIPVSAAGYRERKGDDKMRSLFEKSASITPKEWTDGIQELRTVIEAPDFIGWSGEPTRIANEGARLANLRTAAMFESVSGAGPTLEFDGLSLFNNSHPVNIFDATAGTFDNNQSNATLDPALLATISTYFESLKAPNGQPLGLQFTHVIAPGSMKEQFRQLLDSDLMINAILASGTNTQQTSNNLYKGFVTPIIARELTTANVFYCLASNGPKAWGVVDSGDPEEIVYDMTSGLYKDTGKVGIKYVKTLDVGALMPHAIMRMHIGGSE
jgi:phage major head subunit gpT-like protein